MHKELPQLISVPKWARHCFTPHTVSSKPYATFTSLLPAHDTHTPPSFLPFSPFWDPRKPTCLRRVRNMLHLSLALSSSSSSSSSTLLFPDNCGAPVSCFVDMQDCLRGFNVQRVITFLLCLCLVIIVLVNMSHAFP